MKVLSTDDALRIQGTDNGMMLLNILCGLGLFSIGYSLVNMFELSGWMSNVMKVLGMIMMAVSPVTIGTAIVHQFFSEAVISKNKFDLTYINDQWSFTGNLVIEIDKGRLLRSHVLSLRFGPTPVELPFLKKQDALNLAKLIERHYGENAKCDFGRGRLFI